MAFQQVAQLAVEFLESFARNHVAAFDARLGGSGRGHLMDSQQAEKGTVPELHFRMDRAALGRCWRKQAPPRSSAAARPPSIVAARSIPAPREDRPPAPRCAPRRNHVSEQAGNPWRLAPVRFDTAPARLCECGIARFRAVAVFGRASPRTAKVGLRGVPERALPHLYASTIP